MKYGQTSCFSRVGKNCFWLALLFSNPIYGEVRLPHLISDHMVLQRERPIAIWGWGAPGEKVSVSLGDQSASVTTDTEGKWRATLPAMAAGGPYEMIIQGNNRLAVRDVFVGDVWICSGQSNMAWVMVHRTTNMDQEIAAADYPKMRLLTLPAPLPGQKIDSTPKDDVESQWYVCSPKTVGYFSAVAYYFGRELHRELKVPVGLIASAVSGTRIEPWTPGVGVQSVPELAGKDQVQDGELFNTMIRPLVPFAIRGVIWYQGEGNVGDGFTYFHRMQALVNGWRSVWKQGDFPFYYVQLAPLNWGGKPKDQLPEIWEAQTAALAIRNTGMIVTNDIGNVGDPHPRNKRDVGKRLAALALVKTFGKTNIEYSGPIYRSMSVEGDKIRLHFDHAEGGLQSRDHRPLTWFMIAGEDGKFVPATATIDGNTVVVSSEQVLQPKAVRFAWHQIAEPNLMNAAGLPASAFRTDGPSANRPGSP
jgi:sialate O-acetylesterase